MSLNIFEFLKPPGSFFEEAKNFSKAPEDQIKKLVEYVVELTVRDNPLTVEEYKKKVSVPFETGFGLCRFVRTVIEQSATLTTDQLDQDFRKLEIPEGHIKILLDALQSNRDQLKEHWLEARNEAIPRLCEFNWRIDTRVASSDYLGDKEVVALIRIQVSDNEEYSHVYFELDEEGLSHFESSFNRLKTKFLDAKKAISVAP